jgi:hypothetical protein
MQSSTQEKNDGFYLVIAVSQGRDFLGYRVLDMRSEYQPLMKELAWRAVAKNPTLKGAFWEPRLKLHGLDTPAPSVLVEAYLTGDNALQHNGMPIATIKVPVSNFAYIATKIAAQLKVQGQYSYSITIVESDSKLVSDWYTEEEADFELNEDVKHNLILPDMFQDTVLSEPRKVLEKVDTWLRCLFCKKAFDKYLGAAAKETDRERSWLGLGNVHLTQDVCHVTIEQLIELPGEASLYCITTHGRDWAKLHRKFGDKIVGFLHIHPRWAGTKELTPSPSENDRIVAWNVDLACSKPTVYPIAMFGADVDSPSEHLAVYGFNSGVLTRIQLEIGP